MSNDKRYALVRAGLVENVLVWDGVSGEKWTGKGTKPADWQPWSKGFGEGADLVELGGTDTLVGPGWAYVDDAFAPPPAPPAPPPTVPDRVTMRQARLALLAAGKLAAVGTAIKALPSPQKEAAQVEWDYSATVERASPVVALLASALGLDDAALDALFTAAAAL